MQGTLDEVIGSFKANVEKKPVMWMELVTRELAVLINVSVEQAGQVYLVGRVIPALDALITGLLYTKTDELTVEVISRTLNLLAKLSRDQQGALAIAQSKNIVLRALLYFNRGVFPAEYVLQSLRLLNNCIKTVPDFRGIFLDTHGFTLKGLDKCVSDTLDLFNESLQKGDWDNFTNACSFVSGLSDAFPERAIDF